MSNDGVVRKCHECVECVNPNISCPSCIGEQLIEPDTKLGDLIDPEEAMRETGLHMQFPE